MSPDNLQAGAVAVGAHTAPLAAVEDVSCSGLGVIWEVCRLEERRMGDNGENLADESDGFVAHGVRVSNVGFDDILEWLLDTSLELLKPYTETWDTALLSINYLFNSRRPDYQGSPHCVLHLLDAGVHVVQGHGSWGGHLFRSCRETAAT